MEVVVPNVTEGHGECRSSQHERAGDRRQPNRERAILGLSSSEAHKDQIYEDGGDRSYRNLGESPADDILAEEAKKDRLIDRVGQRMGFVDPRQVEDVENRSLCDVASCQEEGPFIADPGKVPVGEVLTHRRLVLHYTFQHGQAGRLVLLHALAGTQHAGGTMLETHFRPPPRGGYARCPEHCLPPGFAEPA